MITFRFLSGIMILALSLVIILLQPGCKKDNGENIKPIEIGSVTDVDGNIYKTVKIGNQWWMAENLKTTRFNDSTEIPFVADSIAWKQLKTPAYCYYQNDELKYKNIYGALYNWNAVNSGKLAPKGWHVPTDAEWNILFNVLGGNSVAGGKMKEEGATHWISPNHMATNESGFTALPGGCLGFPGYDTTIYSFHNLGLSGYWWSQNGNDTNNCAWELSLWWASSWTSLYYGFKAKGLSIRCVKE